MEVIDKNQDKKCVLLFFTPMFCSASFYDPIINKLQNYRIISVTYDGHEKKFTRYMSIEDEIYKVEAYLKQKNITEIMMAYGASLGAIMAFELFRHNTVIVNRIFLDGGPFFRFSPVIRQLFYVQFLIFCGFAKYKKQKIQKVLAKKALYMNEDAIEMMVSTAAGMDHQNLRNLVKSCYSFDFKKIEKKKEQKIMFFYGTDEKAALCLKKIRKTYNDASYSVHTGLGHLQFQLEKPDQYVQLLKDFIEKK